MLCKSARMCRVQCSPFMQSPSPWKLFIECNGRLMFVCVSASFFSFSYFLSVHYLLHRFPGAVDGASPAIQVHWHAAELAYLKRYRNMDTDPLWRHRAKRVRIMNFIAVYTNSDCNWSKRNLAGQWIPSHQPTLELCCNCEKTDLFSHKFIPAMRRVAFCVAFMVYSWCVLITCNAYSSDCIIWIMIRTDDWGIWFM